MLTFPQTSHAENRLLAAIPESEFAALLPYLTVVPLCRADVLAEGGDIVQRLYFPHKGVVSFIVSMRNGDAAETMTIGREGFTGFSRLFGQPRSFTREIVQVEGVASQIDVAPFLHAMMPGSQLHRLAFLYMGALTAQLLQSAACNALHSVKQRSARWLLMAHDRARDDTFELTQTFFAEMLGVRRATVNQVSQELQKAKLIQYTRGVITILSRSGLENTSCECYRTTRDALDNIYN